jgi:hypothetical protein
MAEFSIFLTGREAYTKSKFAHVTADGDNILLLLSRNCTHINVCLHNGGGHIIETNNDR